MEFHPLVKRFAPWSISKKGTLDNCGSAFHRQYVLKEKPPEKSAAASTGVVTHLIQEKALKKRLPILELTSYAEEVSKDLSEDDRTKVLNKYVPAIKAFENRVQVFKERFNVEHEYIEHKLAMDERLRGVDFFEGGTLPVFLRGVIDHAMLTFDKDSSSHNLVVIDHKTGQKKAIGNHKPQFFTYMLLALANYPTIAGVQCGVNYVGTDKVDWLPRPDGEAGVWTRAEIVKQVPQWLCDYLNSSVPKLTVLADEGTMAPEPGWQCGWCGFSGSCPEGQREIARKAAAAEAKAQAKNL